MDRWPGLALLVAVLSPGEQPSHGLERVAEDQGFVERALAPVFEIIPDYAFPGIENEALSTIVAGVVGTAVLFLLMFGLGRLLARRRTTV